MNVNVLMVNVLSGGLIAMLGIAGLELGISRAERKTERYGPSDAWLGLWVFIAGALVVSVNLWSYFR